MSAPDSVQFDVAATTGRMTASALLRNFLGNSPLWYKAAALSCLIGNPVLLAIAGPTITGWFVVVEFIAALAMALKCYPLQPGGLIAIEAVLLGLTTPQSVYSEVVNAYPVILLLIFMVAGIHFLKDLLIYAFTKLLITVRAPGLLALVFCFSSAVLSAFLDALTVLAVVITVGNAFYEMYHKFACGKPHHAVDHDASTDAHVKELNRAELENFRSFLRGLVMHAAVGTALGGVTTQVGEPQNLLIAKQADWNFGEFFLHVAPVSLPLLAVGLITCLAIEQLGLFGYGTSLPESVRAVIEDHAKAQAARRTPRERAVLIVQACATGVLILALALHLAEVGLIGLLVIVLATSFSGVTEENRIGKAFEAALPFTALLVVFLVIVAAIHDQHLFEPIIDWALSKSGVEQSALFYLANGALSAISDNVFVATIYITEVKAALLEGIIDRTQFDHLSVAINVGTNIPSIATPNGQAAFLFLLTSALAPLIRLSYGRMIWMALPYTITLSAAGLLAIVHWL